MEPMENIITAISCGSARDYIGHVELLAIDLPLAERLRFYEEHQYDRRARGERVPVLFGNLPPAELKIIQEYFSRRIQETRALIR